MTGENDRLTPLMRPDLRLWYLDQAAAVRDGKWAVIDREELAEHIEHRAGDLMRDAEIAFRILIEASLEQDPLDAFEAQEEIRILTRDAPSIGAELEKSYGDLYVQVAHMHFNGYNYRDREGRMSSRIVEFDAERMVGRTRSGRVYELKGPPDFDLDAEYVLRRWIRFNNADRNFEIVAVDTRTLRRQDG